MKHLLVVSDPFTQEQTAFHAALRYAELSFADIHVLNFVYEPLCELQSTNNSRDDAMDLKALAIKHSEDCWSSFLNTQRTKLNVTHETVWTKSMNELILYRCNAKHYDLIVKSGHRSENILHTPTDWHLFRDSDVPVYLVAGSTPGKYKPKKVVLAALDLEESDAEAKAVNERLMEAAFKLSVQTGSALHCCYAANISGVLTELDIIDSGETLRKVAKKIRSQSQPLMSLYDIDPSHLHIRQGQAATEINRLARKLKAQCIVIGSATRKGLAGKIIGNTVEKVAHTAKTDLLVL